MWRGDTRVGFKLKNSWFDSHPVTCHLCCKPFKNEPAVAYIACCISPAHLACAAERLGAVGKCPICWMTTHNNNAKVVFAPIPSLTFLDSLHRFLRSRNYYYVFSGINPPENVQDAPVIDETNAEAFAKWLSKNSTHICKKLTDAGHFDEMLRACEHPSDAIDMFYFSLEEIGQTNPHFDPVIWRTALMDYTTRERPGPSPFSLVFRLVGGDLSAEQMHGLSAGDLVRMGVYYPHLCQLGWNISQNGGALTFSREDLELLHFPKDAIRHGNARDARAH